MSGLLIIDGYSLPKGGNCKIFANGKEIGVVNPLEKKTFEIYDDTKICGKVLINPKGKTITVRDNKATSVHIEWNKTWGTVTFVVDSEVDINNYREVGRPDEENPIYYLNGARGRYIKVYDDRCILGTKAGVASFITGNATDGEKTIYYSDILGVQFKKSGVTLGYLQLETASVTMNNKSDNFFNENSFTFEANMEYKAKEVADYIQRKVSEVKRKSMGGTTVYAASAADELKKFKALLDDGIITQEEFDAKKKQLLGI